MQKESERIFCIQASAFCIPGGIVFTATDIKQMAYCPRIVFFGQCLPGLKVARTYAMQEGSAANEAEEAREHRRGLRAYGLKAGERLFDVYLESESLGFCGALDMLICAGDELIPVDYKNSLDDEVEQTAKARAQSHHNWQAQLAAYALLAEEAFGGQARRGFLYFIPRRRAKLVVLDGGLKDEVWRLLDEMREMVTREAMPEPTPFRGRCRACEFRRFCNDV